MALYFLDTSRISVPDTWPLIIFIVWTCLDCLTRSSCRMFTNGEGCATNQSQIGSTFRTKNEPRLSHQKVNQPVWEVFLYFFRGHVLLFFFEYYYHYHCFTIVVAKHLSIFTLNLEIPRDLIALIQKQTHVTSGVALNHFGTTMIAMCLWELAWVITLRLENFESSLK